MRGKVKISLIILGVVLGLAPFQNCSPVEFNRPKSSPAATTGTPTARPNGEEGGSDDPGLKGGHFDLDTSSQVYEPSRGKTDHHVHEYDDKHNVTEVDYFNLLDSSFTKLTDNIPAGTAFKVIVANAELSPGATLEINGTSVSVVSYEKKISALPVYSLNGSSGSRLASLKIKFAADTLPKGGLVPTQTSCVVKNDLTAQGKYRNGALIIQILDASKAKLDSATGAATEDGGLLWESTIFWHKDGSPCL